jgi:L-threo-3-deoxy-hexylosonate aldolase
LERLYGYGGVPRRPLPPMKGEDVERLWEHGDVRELVGVEREVSGKRGKGKAEEP